MSSKSQYQERESQCQSSEMREKREISIMSLWRADLWVSSDANIKFVFWNSLDSGFLFFFFEGLRNGFLVKFFWLLLGPFLQLLGYFKNGLS